jgi:hypothetical protein
VKDVPPDLCREHVGHEGAAHHRIEVCCLFVRQLIVLGQQEDLRRRDPGRRSEVPDDGRRPCVIDDHQVLRADHDARLPQGIFIGARRLHAV